MAILLIHGYILSTGYTPTITLGINVIKLVLLYIMLNTTLMFSANQRDANTLTCNVDKIGGLRIDQEITASYGPSVS